MKITEFKERTEEITEKLLYIWEGSVKATHSFLSDKEIEEIKKYVPMAVENVEKLIVSVDKNGEITGFMGIENRKIEMLFVSAEKRGEGTGKALLIYAVEKYGADEVTVNEQNPQAKGFYEHMGFSVYKRSETDEQGNNYPILYMKI